MSNVLTSVIPQLLAQGMLQLRKQAFMPRLVNRGYERMAGMQGSTIDIPVASAVAVDDVTASATPGAPTSDLAPTLVSITMTNWKKAGFVLGDNEVLQIMAGTIPMQAAAAIQGLADQINSDIFALYKDVYGYAGVAGTTPFGTDLVEAIDARKTLFLQNCPSGEKAIVLDPVAEAKALALRAIQDASWRNGAEGIREGMIGRTLGFDWFAHQAVPTHTKGAAGTILLDDSAARPIGTKTLHMDGATTKPAAGDVFTIAGDTQTYVVVSSTTLVGTDTDVTFEPGLKVAIPAADGNEAVTFKATHVASLAFHRDAFAFASRPLQDISGNGNIQSVVDPLSGLSLRLEVTRQYKRTLWEFDILYGCKTVRRELACRIAG